MGQKANPLKGRERANMADAIRRLEAGEEDIWVTFKGNRLKLEAVEDWHLEGNGLDMIVAFKGRYIRQNWCGRRKGTGPLRSDIYIHEDSVRAIVVESHPQSLAM